MYKRLNRLLLLVTFLVLTVLGLVFIQRYGNEISYGYSEIIFVEKSTIDLPEQLEKISKEEGLILARRIVSPKNNDTGLLENTYVPIGGERLPDIFPIQSDAQFIRDSPHNTLYVIVDGHLSADQLSQRLNELGNQVVVFPTNQHFALLRLMLTIPQSIMIALVVLVVYATLILSDYISELKNIGVKRLSGQGKYDIALQEVTTSSLFIILLFLLHILGVISFLSATGMLTLIAFFIVSSPLIVWTILLLGINFFLSHLFYHILQQQPIIHAIKGKVPVRLMAILVLVIQLLSLVSVMSSVYGATGIQNDLNTLSAGYQEWSNKSDFYQLTSLDDGGMVNSQQWEVFISDLLSEVPTLSVETTLDHMAMIDTPNKGSFSPTPENVSNVIYVNEQFIEEVSLNLDKETKARIANLKEHDRLVLLPQEVNQFDNLSKAWRTFLERGFLPDNIPYENPYPDSVLSFASYNGGEKVFVFPVFSSVGQLWSNEVFVKYPIIVIEKISVENFIPSNILVASPEKVLELIKKHQMTSALGALTNGKYAILQKIQQLEIKRNSLFTVMLVGGISSLLLIKLLVTIYFYQGRREFLIKRLAGYSLLALHRLPLMLMLIIHLCLSLIAFFIGFSITIVMVPIAYLLCSLIVFFVVMQKEKGIYVRYLKGGQYD
ncbi:DUF1430 domain-containing protein [Streptococcus sp. E17BB]|uniref:DUF1430 domain-containing protein n=1 Tax=Streptococcus sp. E17BB TaxID=3278714 RepID=UPI00359CF7C4